ncbi:MAG: DUF2279 domain-containing protein [Flavobacteriaceae bacterium]|nr:DUF2279 domain-containing protein [Flavobacteriaceae bacterium]
MRFLAAHILLLLCLFQVQAQTQTNFDYFLTPSDTLNQKRLNGVIIGESVIYTGSMLALNELWYNDFDRSKFHTVQDFNEWSQMDKVGHIYSSYQLGRLGAEILNWSGVEKHNQLKFGATLGLVFLSTVEVFDGYSEEWGFSWSDMAANLAGTGIFIGQELLWEEQRISLKYSFHQTKYAPQRPDKLGDGFFEEFLKDYNGQTYWLSANIKSFFPGLEIPSWLNVALGYGAEGMLTADSQPINGTLIGQEAVRQYYLSMDIDFSRIKTNSPLLKTLFSLVNTLKVPFPAVEFTDKNGFRLLGIYY